MNFVGGNDVQQRRPFGNRGFEDNELGKDSRVHGSDESFLNLTEMLAGDCEVDGGEGRLEGGPRSDGADRSSATGKGLRPAVLRGRHHLDADDLARKALRGHQAGVAAHPSSSRRELLVSSNLFFRDCPHRRLTSRSALACPLYTNSLVLEFYGSLSNNVAGYMHFHMLWADHAHFLSRISTLKG